VEDFQTQVSELDKQLSHRTRELDVIRSELKAVKDFRRKRAQMQRELEEVITLLLSPIVSYMLVLKSIFVIVCMPFS